MTRVMGYDHTSNWTVWWAMISIQILSNPNLMAWSRSKSSNVNSANRLTTPAIGGFNQTSPLSGNWLALVQAQITNFKRWRVYFTEDNRIVNALATLGSRPSRLEFSGPIPFPITFHRWPVLISLVILSSSSDERDHFSSFVNVCRHFVLYLL